MYKRGFRSDDPPVPSYRSPFSHVRCCVQFPQPLGARNPHKNGLPVLCRLPCIANEPLEKLGRGISSKVREDTLLPPRSSSRKFVYKLSILLGDVSVVIIILFVNTTVKPEGMSFSSWDGYAWFPSSVHSVSLPFWPKCRDVFPVHMPGEAARFCIHGSLAPQGQNHNGEQEKACFDQLT